MAGHVRIAREGVSLALADALSLVEPLLNGIARALFDVDAKARKLATAP